MALLVKSASSSLLVGRSVHTKLTTEPDAVDAKLRAELSKLGIQRGPERQAYNLSRAEVRLEEINNHEGVFVQSGALAIDTGKYTGRSPLDKFFVKPAQDTSGINWGDINQPTTPSTFEKLNDKIVKHFSDFPAKLYVFDGILGADRNWSLRVRVVSESAYHHHFCLNMLRSTERPKNPATWNPDVTMLVAPSCYNSDYVQMDLHSETFIVANTEKSMILIGGSNYSGEIKKGFFSWINYQLPLQQVLTLHCSATRAMNDRQDVVLFLGLSGTGKTTLSADPKRLLVGDDEHGWDDRGIFNIEGGCYAKVINLKPATEPAIFNAIGKDAILENVVVTEDGEVDFADDSKTQNTRCSYPLHSIQGHEPSGMAGHPHTIVFLTCDVYGVLPPVSRLTTDQAIYHFLAGYTSKVAGTERGVESPQATFSACYGAAFMPLAPQYYAELLRSQIARHHVAVYLVNTGWTNGSICSGGHRIPIETSRAIVDALVSHNIDSFEPPDPIFNLSVPTSVPGVDSSLLDPRKCWPDPALYNESALKVLGLFEANSVSVTQ